MKKLISIFMLMLLLAGCAKTEALPKEEVVKEVEAQTTFSEEVNIQAGVNDYTTQQKLNILLLDTLTNNPNRYILVGPDVYSGEDNVFTYNGDTYTNIYYNPQIPMPAQDQNELFLACNWYGVNYYIMIGLIEEECIFDFNYSRIPKYTFGYFQLEDNITNCNIMDVTTNIWLGVERFSNYLNETEDIETAILYYNEGIDEGFVDRVMHYAYAWGYNYDVSEGYYDEVLGDVAIIEN